MHIKYFEHIHLIYYYYSSQLSTFPLLFRNLDLSLVSHLLFPYPQLLHMRETKHYLFMGVVCFI